MVKVRQDLTGQTFGQLTVICQAEDYINPKGEHRSQWLCECNCEAHNQIIVQGSKLKSGWTRSCGCLQKATVVQMFRKHNTYSEKLTDEHGEYYIGYTINTNAPFYFDAEDFDKVDQYCWCEDAKSTENYRNLRAYNPATQKTIKLHQVVAGKYYDHIDRNPFNNRKYNLRKATAAENARNRSLSKNNTSGIIGVIIDSRSGSWRARIKLDGKLVHLGSFKNKEDAIKTRLAAELKYFGEFAPQSHLFKEYNIE